MKNCRHKLIRNFQLPSPLITVMGCMLLVDAVAGQEPVFQMDFGKHSKIPAFATGVGNPVIQPLTKQARALYLDGSSYLRIKSYPRSLQFNNGKPITISAWVAPYSVSDGQQVYVVGKGRTNRKDFPAENQNYAIRLRGINGDAKVSFLFRSRNAQNGKQQYHRWNSLTGFVADGSWHHIAVQYQFGKPETITAWVDGKASKGKWDMGGPTTDPPVVDEDELWIGSSLGGSANSSFTGWIGSVKIFSSLIAPNRIQQLAITPPPALPLVKLDPTDLSDQQVLVEVFEMVPERLPPFPVTNPPSEKFLVSHLALDGLPNKYVSPGVIGDRSGTFLLRCRIRKFLAAGDYEFLIRGKSASVLIVGKQIVGKLPMMQRNASGHEPVPELASYSDPSHYPPPAGHQEKIIPFYSEGGEHIFRWETLVGGRGLRNELGESVVAFRQKGKKDFQILSNQSESLPLTYDVWDRLSERNRHLVLALEKTSRMTLAAEDEPYWRERHRKGNALAHQQMPQLNQLSIDLVVERQLEHLKMKPAAIVRDEVFLRRVYLDVIGILPTADQIEQFMADQKKSKRSDVIDKLLESSGYADHWVSYWQDVLAENPGILKPKLNNTGPFRFYILESLLDNKPMDRFAAELIAMQGSRTGGGPAGFGQATQNDVPTAAKANVLSRAFLGIDLTCARCHDSPSNHFRQKDLFEMAAMLNRKPIVVPKTSTVPGIDELDAIKASLTAGSRVSPQWPFGQELPFDGVTGSEDPRRRLAEMITSPDNPRFARVIANRIWTRIMSRGLVDSADDFLLGRPSNPELLDYLGNYLRANNYDARKLIRLIMNSKTYQRTGSEDPRRVHSFASRAIKTMTAEQIVDSLFSLAGKSLSLGTISFDPEGRRTADTFLNLGKPQRAWELTSLANERDRPALALPRAQAIVDILNAFGWRESRPNPLTDRDPSQTLVQPLVLANGAAAHRITQLSDDSVFTIFSLRSPSINRLVTKTYLQILGRLPSGPEMQLCRSLLEQDYANRIVPGASASPVYDHQFRSAVSWSNHLHPDATKIKLRIEEAVRRGDFKTKRLASDWRERMEDLVWALINSPEFILIR